MDEVETLARTMAEQRTGDAGLWQEFVDAVREAIRLADEQPGATARDFLDEPTKPQATPGQLSGR